jgi:ABC-2 type transport system permease protein
VLSLAETENPTRLLTGRFDVAFVIVYLYPLLILALSYNLLSFEKEEGTLALALSQPVPLGLLILGKVLLRGLVFVVFVVSLTAIASLVGGVPLSTADAFLRFCLWTSVVAVYGLFWFAIAVGVAAMGQPSATNAMVLAGAWLTVTVLLPSAFNLAAITLYPVPSRVEMIQAVREASDDANAEGARLLGQYYQDHPELSVHTPERATSDFNLVRLAVDERIEKQVRPVVAAYDEQLERQQRMIGRLRFLSPAVLVQDALNDLSGSGSERHRTFIGQVVRYHQAWRNYFVPLVIRKAQMDNYQQVPRFTFVEEPLSTVAQRVTVGLIGLASATLLTAGFGFSRLRRYSVVA